jgi:hypothetical protein
MALPLRALAVDVFVSAAGNDAHEGTREQPFRTIRKAADVMAPGDRCVVGAGEYAEPIRPSRSGLFDSPICFMAATGATVTLVIGGAPAANAAAPRWGVNLAGLTLVQVAGFQVRGGGINLANARYCRVQDCHVAWEEGGEPDGEADRKVDNSAAAILLGGKENEVSGCSVTRSPAHGMVLLPGSANNRVVDVRIIGAGSKYPSACGIVAGGAAHTVQRVLVERSGGTALMCRDIHNARLLNNEFRLGGGQTAGVPLVRITGNGKGTVIAYNRIYDNQSREGDGVFFDGMVENYIVHHNVICGQPRDALHLSGAVQYCYVFNNTCALNGRSVGGGTADGSGPFRGLRFFNNIFTGAVWDGLAGKPGPEVVWESNYVGAAPGFIDEAARDFRLKPDSPCIDAGQDEPELTDGYRGKHPDAGAYETSI